MTAARASSGGASGNAATAAGGGGAAPPPSSIPSAARDKVRSIMEVVQNTEEEVYAILKESNMDVNEAVQRLLAQDTFHEVKRRRDKKREQNKEATETKPTRAYGPSTRGGRSGRGGRYNSNGSGGGRGRSFPRENGYIASEGSSAQETPQAPPKVTNQPSNAVQGVQDGPFQPRSTPPPIGSRQTMADHLKANGPTAQYRAAPSRTTEYRPAPPRTTDPVIEKSLEPVNNRKDVGVVGNQWSTNEGNERFASDPEGEPPVRASPQTEQTATTNNHPLDSRTSSSTAAPGPAASRPPSRPAQQGTHKPGPVQEWKVKPKSSESLTAVQVERVSAAPQKLEVSSNEKEEQQQSVIIHNQFLVSADLGLNFGSLRFGSSDEDTLTPEPASEAEEPVEEPEPDNQPSPSTVSSTQVSVEEQNTSSVVDNLPSNSEVTAVSIAVQPSISQQSDLSKSDTPVVQTTSHYPYLPTYSGFGLMQPASTQYQYESTTDGSDPTRLSHYTDPTVTTSFYNSYRPTADGDVRGYQFLNTKSSSQGGKYSGTSVGLTSSESGTGTQTSQPSNAQSLPLSHQPLPLYSPQPGIHMGYNMFNYPYMPQSLPYMHAPYQHSFPGSSAYPQPAAGSSYNSYPNPNKYPTMAQFKPVTSTASAAGYTGYTSSPAGYATNPTVTASVYEDVGGPQYKDNIYIQSQQPEGSQVWLSRDSFYGQNQHAAYAQQHHAHPTTAYGSLYHPTQSVPTPNSHQMLQQQPQALAAAGTQAAAAAAYAQQAQRAQQSWNNNY